MTHHKPLKEGNTPTEFLTAWSNAFSSVFADKKDPADKTKVKYLMTVCDESLKQIYSLYPQNMTNAEVVMGLNAFIEYFQKGVIDAGGNPWEAQRRINMLRECIQLIQGKKPQPQFIQTKLF